MKKNFNLNLTKGFVKLSSFLMIAFGCTFFAADATAQGTIQPRLGDAESRFGIKGGLNLSNFRGSGQGIDNEQMKFGMHAGVFAKIGITEFFSIQPEILYSNRGSQTQYKQLNTTVSPGGSSVSYTGQSVRFNLNYLEFPVLAKVNMGGFSLHAGPYLAYLLNANVKIDKAEDDFDTQYRQIDKRDFNSVDYGVALGLGYDIGRAQLYGRYQLGLGDVNRSGEKSEQISGQVRNSVFQFGVGFGF